MSFLFNATFCALGASCVALGFTGTALATVDGGATADLLAVSGVGHRYATVIEADVQSECEHKGCRVYTVDLAKAEFRRQEPRRLVVTYEDRSALAPGELFDRYVALLPEASQAKLRVERVLASELTPVETDENKPPVTLSVQGKPVRATLQSLWSTPSANAFDRNTAGSDLCVDGYAQKALCSACHTTVRWLDGERIDTWECDPKGRRTDANPEDSGEEGAGAVDAPSRPCACAAQAHMMVLELVSGERRGRGSKVLVEPFRTWQDVEGPPGSWYDDTGLSYGTGQSSLRFLLTPEGVLLAFGSAVHIPFGNSTHFPVFSSLNLTEPR